MGRDPNLPITEKERIELLELLETVTGKTGLLKKRVSPIGLLITGLVAGFLLKGKI